MNIDFALPPLREIEGTTSQALKERVGHMIRRYVRESSRDLATAVVRDLEALCQHPDYGRDSQERCAYRRLAKHWRWLSGNPSEVGYQEHFPATL